MSWLWQLCCLQHEQQLLLLLLSPGPVMLQALQAASQSWLVLMHRHLLAPQRPPWPSFPCTRLLLLTVWAPELALVYGVGILLGLATGLFVTTNWALGTRLAPDEQAGRYMGVGISMGGFIITIGMFDVAEVALELMHRLHGEWAYQPRSTSVDTPLAAAFAQRSGVCQDFAHLLIASCRAHGLPARYVSGYLLTEPAPGEPALLGADASHAWVQVWCPGTPGVPAHGWLDLDPTNNLVPATDHVRVAVGRDFGDVTPLRGVIRGGGAHSLSVGVTTRRLLSPSADDVVPQAAHAARLPASPLVHDPGRQPAMNLAR